jgi:hypothetical protein
MRGHQSQHGHPSARLRARRTAAAAACTGVFLATLVACGENGPSYLTSIAGATGQDTPQNAVRGFFDELVRGDYRASESYVDPTERQSYANGIQSIPAGQYSVQIQSFRVVAFDGDQSGGTVGVKVTGQSCLRGKCSPLSQAADGTASIPVTFANNQWYVTDVSAPS